jgi:HemY protein
MIRVLIFLIVVGLLAYGVALLSDQPGDVVITWQGLRIETSLMMLGAAMLAAMVVIALIWSLIRAILRSPIALATLLRNRRGVRAYEAISHGLIAVGSGDVSAARKFTTEVNRIAPGEPLALLLSAQTAQLTGDRDRAEQNFRAMASRADTKTLGLHGLYIEAQRRGDLTSARAYAEEAARTVPSLGWAGRAVLEFRCATGDWAGALALLDANKPAIDKASYRRQRAVLLTARALAAEDSDRDGAKAFALEAVKLAPTLVPAAALAGRRLAEGGELRKASRIIGKAWSANPHPDLAATYAELRFGDSARDRLTRIEALAKKVPENIEGALAIARAALDARQFAKARAALAPYLAAPTKRVALLMAELERAERNDEGRAREWMRNGLPTVTFPTGGCRYRR